MFIYLYTFISVTKSQRVPWIQGEQEADLSVPLFPRVGKVRSCRQGAFWVPGWKFGCYHLSSVPWKLQNGSLPRWTNLSLEFHQMTSECVLERRAAVGSTQPWEGSDLLCTGEVEGKQPATQLWAYSTYTKKAHLALQQRGFLYD